MHDAISRPIRSRRKCCKIATWGGGRVYRATQAAQLVYTGSHFLLGRSYKFMICREGGPRRLTQKIDINRGVGEVSRKIELNQYRRSP
jgi:hypothetical protein